MEREGTGERNRKEVGHDVRGKREVEREGIGREVGEARKGKTRGG